MDDWPADRPDLWEGFEFNLERLLSLLSGGECCRGRLWKSDSWRLLLGELERCRLAEEDLPRFLCECLYTDLDCDLWPRGWSFDSIRRRFRSAAKDSDRLPHDRFLGRFTDVLRELDVLGLRDFWLLWRCRLLPCLELRDLDLLRSSSALLSRRRLSERLRERRRPWRLLERERGEEEVLLHLQISRVRPPPLCRLKYSSSGGTFWFASFSTLISWRVYR